MNFMRGGRPGLASAAILEYWAVDYGYEARTLTGVLYGRVIESRVYSGE